MCESMCDYDTSQKFESIRRLECGKQISLQKVNYPGSCFVNQLPLTRSPREKEHHGLICVNWQRIYFRKGIV